MASIITNNLVNNQQNNSNKYNNNADFRAKKPHRGKMKPRPATYRVSHKDKDKLRNNDVFTKFRINIENTMNTPSYLQRGLKGDPDFNFFESLRLSKIPYYLGGLGLAAVCLAGRNNFSPAAKSANNEVFRKILSGVLMYYVGREAANMIIDAPVKAFRGIDLNMPYKKVTALREGNPLNLPSNKKQSTQRVLDSTEFPRWDLLYKYNNKKGINETFDKLAKKFGADDKQIDSDSKVTGQILKLVKMANSWKSMLSVPFVTLGLGLAQQKSFANIDVRSLFKNTINLLKPTTTNRLPKFIATIKENIAKPVGNSFKELWIGNSTGSRIMGRGSIILAAGLSLLANIMILNKTSLKNDSEGGNQ